MCKYLLLFLLFPCFIYAQLSKRYYTNVLKDIKGNPVAGGIITNQTTRQSTSTNKNGYFSIAAVVGDRISIAYVGYIGNTLTITESLLQPDADTLLKEVKPVLSNDYAALMRQRITTNKSNFPDSVNHQNIVLQSVGNINSYLPIKEIRIHNK